jgi:hypothetical protein
MTEPGSEFIADEMDLRRRMRDALRELAILIGHRNLVYVPRADEQAEVTVIHRVSGQLYFEVYNDPDDDNEEPIQIFSDMTDEELVETIVVIDEPSIAPAAADE